MAGIHAVHRFVQQGLSVQGFETGAGVGGVWFHNGYPGARVDTESLYYSYYFSPELFREWKWSERLAAQPEVLDYLNYAADKFDVKRHFRFSCRVTKAQWDADRRQYEIYSAAGLEATCRFLVMATGHLSEARRPDFAGIDGFGGPWLQTSHWPAQPPQLSGKRIAVIGTGSSGVQIIPQLAETAEHLYVFQRTANYGVPAGNGPLDEPQYEANAERVTDVYRELLRTSSGMIVTPASGRAIDYSPRERRALLEQRWAMGGHNLNLVFTDQSTNQWSNDIVSDFVRSKVSEIVEDPDVASKLIPREYPIGMRRMASNTNYYETFNRPNVTLVDIKADPIQRITRTGIRTLRGHHVLDVIVFALGFDAFTGAIDSANIRNAELDQPADRWKRGPLTYLGLMTANFPNLFFITGPGSPSVLANLFVQSIYHARTIGDLIAYMNLNGYTWVEPTEAAEAEWSRHVDELAKPLLRRSTPNYMLHLNRDDGSRVFIPYSAGLNRYVDEVDAVVRAGYEGFSFS
jgi:cation diffusion facilitator CzcD-associated flavoprotein CzcO